VQRSIEGYSPAPTVGRLRSCAVFGAARLLMRTHGPSHNSKSDIAGGQSAALIAAPPQEHGAVGSVAPAAPLISPVSNGAKSPAASQSVVGFSFGRLAPLARACDEAARGGLFPPRNHVIGFLAALALVSALVEIDENQRRYGQRKAHCLATCRADGCTTMGGGWIGFLGVRHSVRAQAKSHPQ
jgi:hypothetical protein